MATVNGLWIGERLAPLERACVQSFLAKGHEFNLYGYEAIADVPAGCRVLDAATILPAAKIFTHASGISQGSFGAFSDMFRYQLLHEHGGWWADMDVFCLASELPDAGAVIGRQDPQHLNGAVMRFPRGHELMSAALSESLGCGAEVEWGEIGPNLLTRLVAARSLSGAVFPESVFYPIHCFHFWTMLDPRRTAYVAEKVRGAACVHLWNEMLRRIQFDKYILPPHGSFLRSLYEWTIGIDGFTQEYVLAPSCKPDALDLQVIPRRADG